MESKERFNTPNQRDVLGRAGVPPETLTKMQSILGDDSSPAFAYPWSSLESSLDSAGKKKLLLIGYGSLLNRDSAARTIKDTPPLGHEPVLCVGSVRLFNYVISDKRLLSYGGNVNGKERAALNMQWTKSPTDFFNGRLIPVSAEDIPALREREFGYDLKQVICQMWGKWTESPFVAYILVAPATPVKGRIVTDDSLLPQPAYYQICREGAAAVSADFLNVYLHTTFLGDRRTNLVDWERLHPPRIQPDN